MKKNEENEKEITFVQALVISRKEFCKEIAKHDVSRFLTLRTEVDSFLIMHDQLFEKYKDLSEKDL